jgi:hypothetical protein
MAYIIGMVLALAVAAFARVVGFDRDRAFYATVVMVVASYYVLFAAMSGSLQTVLLESVGTTVFIIAAVVGFRSSDWIVAAALAGHGIFDLFHGHLVENTGMPLWWPAFCAAYDLAAGGALAWLISRRPRRTLP